MVKRKTREEKLAELPVWYSANEIWWSYMQLKHFLMPNLIDLRRGDYPPEPDEYKSYYNDRGWVHKKHSGYQEQYFRKFRPIGFFVVPAEIAAEIDYRIEQIKTYRIQLDNILVPISSDLLIDVYTENLPVDGESFNEAEMMLNYISGWKRKGFSFKKYRDKIRRE